MSTDNVDCGSYISTRDVQAVKAELKKHSEKGLSTRDENVIQAAITLIKSEPHWVWKNAEIFLHGDDLYKVLYAGNRSNKYVVNLTQEGYGDAKCTYSSWRLFFWKGAVCVWKLFAGIVGGVLLAIAGSVGKLAIGWIK